MLSRRVNVAEKIADKIRQLADSPGVEYSREWQVRPAMDVPVADVSRRAAVRQPSEPGIVSAVPDSFELDRRDFQCLAHRVTSGSLAAAALRVAVSMWV